jgi:hypothetical protein
MYRLEAGLVGGFWHLLEGGCSDSRSPIRQASHTLHHPAAVLWWRLRGLTPWFTSITFTLVWAPVPYGTTWVSPFPVSLTLSGPPCTTLQSLLVLAKDGFLARYLAGGRSREEIKAVARDGPAEDTPESLRRGWQRMSLLVLYFNPSGGCTWCSCPPCPCLGCPCSGQCSDRLTVGCAYISAAGANQTAACYTHVLAPQQQRCH